MVYLFGEKIINIYIAIALAFIFVGTLVSSDFVWEMTDLFNNFMVIPNVIALFALTDTVVASCGLKNKLNNDN